LDTDLAGTGESFLQPCYRHVLTLEKTMRIFVSYASEQRPIAERLAMALRSEGHDVFFDRLSLPRGQAYDGRIREEIEHGQLFILLISPNFLDTGSYTLSELDMIARRVPVPGDRVLPVMIERVPIEAVPNYLRPLNILSPVGDLVADVLAAVHELVAAHRAVRRRRFAVAAAVAIVAAALGGFLLWRASHRPVSSQTAAPAPVVLQQALSVFRSPDQNSEIIDQVKEEEEVTLDRPGDNPTWIGIRTRRTQGWAMAQDVVLKAPDKDAIALGQGFGFQGSFWKLFFTSPQPGGKPPNKFGIDVRFADAIGRTQKSLDIAVYELNSRLITDAIIAVHRLAQALAEKATVIPVQGIFEKRIAEVGKSVVLRTLCGPESRVKVRLDSNPRYLHHDVFVIDGETVITGSLNFSRSALKINDENVVIIPDAGLARRYEAEFNRIWPTATPPDADRCAAQ
jgi:hypothetical protein